MSKGKIDRFALVLLVAVGAAFGILIVTLIPWVPIWALGLWLLLTDFPVYSGAAIIGAFGGLLFYIFMYHIFKEVEST